MNANSDKQILLMADEGSIYWCKREGGSEAYQIHRNRIHEMVKEGLLIEAQDGCCYRDYYITSTGKEILHGT